jgi:hypothetical protein
MNAPGQPQPPQDWQRWAVQLDACPSNRRLVQQARTPRTLRDAGLDDSSIRPGSTWRRFFQPDGRA